MATGEFPQTAGGPGPGDVTPRTIEFLKQTKPWVRFIAVLMFIGCALLVLAALVVIVAGAAFTDFGRVFTVPLGIMYFLLGLLYFVPALFLFRYADAIENLMRRKTSDALESALEHQKSFWKFVGILTVILLIAYGLMLIIMLFIAMAVN